MSVNSYRDKLVQPGHFIGLKFDKGWWFIQAIGIEYVEAKPWTLENSNGNRNTLSANTSGTNDQNIADSNSNRILEPNDEERNTVHQIFYGVSPSRMQVFTLFGRDRNVALEDYDEPGEVGAWMSGHDSPYDNPAPETEVFYINDMAPLRFQPYNPMSESHEAKMSFHVNKIRYITVTNKNVMKAILQGQQPGKMVMMGLGANDNDQVGIPSWLNRAFGEHIYTTGEILEPSEEQTTEPSRVVEGAANLQGE